MSSRDLPRAADVTVSIILTLLMAFVVVTLSVVVGISSISVAGCAGRSCDLSAAQASIFVTPGVGVVVMSATIAVAIVRGVRGRSLWVVPAFGILAVVIGSSSRSSCTRCH